jgi:hypothetical protein
VTALDLLTVLRSHGLWFTQTVPGTWEHHTGGPYIRIDIGTQVIGMFYAYGTDAPKPGIVIPVGEVTADEVVRFLAGRSTE